MKLLQKTTLLEFLKSKTGKTITAEYMLRKYAYDSTVFVLEKEESEKTFTEKRIARATGIDDLSKYTIMTSWLFTVKLNYINTHNYSNVALIEKKLNVNKANSEYKTIKSERAKLECRFVEKARIFKTKAEQIRIKKIREQEALNASYAKGKLTSRIVNLLENELKQEALNAVKIKDLSQSLCQINNTTRVSNALIDFLKEKNFEIEKVIKFECSSASNFNKKQFKFTIEAPIWQVLQRGAYSLYFDNFLKKMGEHWSENLNNFKCNLEFLKYGI